MPLEPGSHGDREAATRELLAWTVFRRQRPGPTLQPTAPVHEAFRKRIDPARVEVRDRAHSRALAATAMRQVLTDHARRRPARKRGGDRTHVSWVEPSSGTQEPSMDLLAPDEALTHLATLDPRQHRTVERERGAR